MSGRHSYVTVGHVPEPPAGGFPSAASTGVPNGTQLTTVDHAMSGAGWTSNANGDVTVAAGATVTALNVRGGVELQAGATLTNSRVCGVGQDQAIVIMRARTTLSHCDVGGGLAGNTMTYAYCIWTGDFDDTTDRNVIEYCNLHNGTRGIQLDGQTIVRENYLHDSVFDCCYHNSDPIPANEECGAHSSACFMSKGHHILVEHNTMSHGNTAIIFGQVYDTPPGGDNELDDVIIRNNRFQARTYPGGMSSFAVNIEKRTGTIPNPSTIVITQNVTDEGPWDIEQYRNDYGGQPCGYTITNNTTVPAGSPIDP